MASFWVSRFFVEHALEEALEGATIDYRMDASVIRFTTDAPVRKPTAAKFGTTRSTTPAKKQLDCAIGESSERQWKMIQRDRDARGSDFLRGERLSNFAKEDAEAKKQAAEVFGYKGSGAQRN